MRTIALTLAVALACIGAAPAPVPDAHADALGVLADIRAAVAEIVHVEDSYTVGHGYYLREAHRTMNALVGRRDDGYLAAAGDPGDGIGALGHLDHMLDQTATYAWTPAAEGAKANVLAAAADIQDALGDKEMEDYQTDLTRTLANLALVVGQSDGEGALGGLRGALANTTLGVPRGAATVSGCSVPTHVPAYGVVGGSLVYVALPRHDASATLADGLNIRRIVVRGDALVLYTHAAGDASLCGRTAQTPQPAQRQRTRDVVAVAGTATPPFTSAQAHVGAAVYRQYCIQCHGVDLQGTAGPSVAGKDFLQTAATNRWTVDDLRTIVVENMPFSNPGSLTSAQYANVLAFLLASNCYPAGSTPFPTAKSPKLAAIKIATPSGTTPSNAKLGTCTVR